MGEAIGAFYALEREAHDARDVGACQECHDTAAKGTVFKFYTRRGARWREHEGYFCSQDCHDRWHGLKRNAATAVPQETSPMTEPRDP